MILATVYVLMILYTVFAALSDMKLQAQITNVHLLFARSPLFVHLSLLFTAMICRCFVPSDFCYGVIVPLLNPLLALVL